MTNDQYEKDSVMRGLQDHDHVIHSLEEALRVANESRREYVNRHNLNKHEHTWIEVRTMQDENPEMFICECGAKKPYKDPDQHAHMVD